MYNMLPRRDGLAPAPRLQKKPAPERRKMTALTLGRGGVDASACSPAPPYKGTARIAAETLFAAWKPDGTRYPRPKSAGGLPAVTHGPVQ